MKRYLAMFAMVLLLALVVIVGAEVNDESFLPEQRNTDASQSTESVVEEGVITSSEEQIQAEFPAAALSAQYGAEGGEENSYGP